jgi:hypothetical protein
MYKLFDKYKFETKQGIFWTGTVIAEDEINLKIQTIRNEEIILLKSEIVRATKWQKE